jgi:hypothetical protein
MTPRQKSLSQLILAVLIAVVAASAFWAPPLGFVAGGLTIALAIWQFRSVGGVDVPFETDDWRADGDGLVLKIPYAKHGKRSPDVTTFERDEEGNLKVFECDVVRDDEHNVCLYCSNARDLAGVVHIA